MRGQKKWLRVRIIIVMGLFLVVFLALVTRAFQLQILSGRVLKELASRQHVSTLKTQPERGMIVDRNGEKLAVSLLTDSLCADPEKIADRVGTARKIASLLNLDEGTVAKNCHRPKFCWIARRITPEEAARVAELDVDGLSLSKNPNVLP